MRAWSRRSDGCQCSRCLTEGAIEAVTDGTMLSSLVGVAEARLLGASAYFNDGTEEVVAVGCCVGIALIDGILKVKLLNLKSVSSVVHSLELMRALSLKVLLIYFLSKGVLLVSAKDSSSVSELEFCWQHTGKVRKHHSWI